MNKKLAKLNVAWSEIDGEGLIRVVPTDSFSTGVYLTTTLAALAEKQGHDPEVLITNSKVVITLISHDESAITERDYKFAAAVDGLLDEAKAHTSATE
jgi:pterin-4a-carbinolamine dehydratase